jgi:carotenoid cleavage dioxygenase-like enzyme
MKSTTSADAIHAALTRNLRREHGFEPMEVEGTLPPDLEGTLYRVGPGSSSASGAGSTTRSRPTAP